MSEPIRIIHPGPHLGMPALLATTALLVAACGGEPAAEATAVAMAAPPLESIVTVRDSMIDATLEAAGIAEPIQRAILSTKLMGAVTAVAVQEGDRVREGQVVATIDARDIAARRAQVTAGIAAAEAVERDAETQLARIRSLHADSAATRVQLEAAETGLSRATAAAASARAGAAELDAVGAYARIRAPFAGIVTRRFVDVGAFVAPGASVVTVEDARRLRLRVTTTPAARSLAAGTKVQGTIEGMPVDAVIEGVVPTSGAVYTVNAVVDNADGTFPSGGTATLRLPTGSRNGLLVPAAAIIQEGDLIGVRVVGGAGSELRWIRVGEAHGDMVEVLSGLRAGDRILLPPATPGGR
jgi:RND family efflux transporter MFP subunit